MALRVATPSDRLRTVSTCGVAKKASDAVAPAAAAGSPMARASGTRRSNPNASPGPATTPKAAPQRAGEKPNNGKQTEGYAGAPMRQSTKSDDCADHAVADAGQEDNGASDA